MLHKVMSQIKIVLAGLGIHTFAILLFALYKKSEKSDSLFKSKRLIHSFLS